MWEPGKAKVLVGRAEGASCQVAKLVIANEVRIGGLGGGRLQTDAFHAFPNLIRVEFCGLCTRWQLGDGGVRPPLVRPLKCIWGGWNGG